MVRVMSPFITTPLSSILSSRSISVSCRGESATSLRDNVAHRLAPFHFAVGANATILEPMFGAEPFEVFLRCRIHKKSRNYVKRSSALALRASNEDPSFTHCLFKAIVFKLAAY